MAAMLSLRLECGITHSSRRALLPLRRRVRKSAIGSVMVDVFVFVAGGSYPTPAGKMVYQDDFVTPGILPARASSRKVMRETPNLPMWPRGRPLYQQRLRTRLGEEFLGSFWSFFCAAKNSSSVVAGLRRMALSSARLALYFLVRRWRFLLRSMAEVFGMAGRVVRFKW